MPRKLITVNRTLGVGTFNLPPGLTCRGRTKWCAKYCYACRGNFTYPNVADSLIRKYEMTQDRRLFIDDICEELSRYKLPAFRIHSSGDFYSFAYYSDWLEIIERTPHIEFFAYTRMWHIGHWLSILRSNSLPGNFHLWFSIDPSDDEVPVWPRLAFIEGAPMSGEVTCKKQLDHGENCLTCKLCWLGNHSRVTFRKH